MDKTDQFLTDLIQKNSFELRTKDEIDLRDILRRLEDECSTFEHEYQDHLCHRVLWIRLVEFSLGVDNIHLAQLVIAKLKLVQLALLVRSALNYRSAQDDQNIDVQNQSIAFAYISSYFNLNHNNTSPLWEQRTNQAPAGDEPLSRYNRVIEFHIDGGNWKKALDFIQKKFPNAHQKELNQQRVFYKLARHCEVDENFQEALANYERSNTQRDHALRILVKQFIETGYQQVKTYCSTTNIGLRDLWAKYALACGDYVDASEAFSANKDLASFVACSFLMRRNPMAAKREVFNQLPEPMKQFIDDSNPNKWMSKRTIDYLISIGISLSSNVRAGLAELARQYYLANQPTLACSIYLCLNQTYYSTNRLMPFFMNHLDRLKLTCDFGSSSETAVSLIQYLDLHQKQQILNSKSRSKITQTNDDDDDDDDMMMDTHVRSKESRTIFEACLKLGLLDEVLQVFARDPIKDETTIGRAIEHLECLIEDQRLALDNVDPVLQDSTLSEIYKHLANNQTLSTYVITYVILSMNIFLHKLDTVSDSSAAPDTGLDASISQLESTFNRLSEYFNELTFNASDVLIRSANSLVITIKDRLDCSSLSATLLTDSDVIREGFRLLVENIAGRCMIECQYKSAAMLYSHIEDNLSAVKALMRTGDLDVVINYSLLVRDITVTRVTINYLKHLNVESTVIEDFITRSKL